MTAQVWVISLSNEYLAYDSPWPIANRQTDSRAQTCLHSALPPRAPNSNIHTHSHTSSRINFLIHVSIFCLVFGFIFHPFCHGFFLIVFRNRDYFCFYIYIFAPIWKFTLSLMFSYRLPLIIVCLSVFSFGVQLFSYLFLLTKLILDFLNVSTHTVTLTLFFMDWPFSWSSKFLQYSLFR